MGDIFLLIVVVFFPQNGHSMTRVEPFPTMQTCQAEKYNVEHRKLDQISNESGLYMTVSCERGIPVRRD